MKRAELLNQGVEKNTFDRFVPLLQFNGANERDEAKTILKSQYSITELFLFEICTYVFCDMTRSHMTLSSCTFHMPRLDFAIFYYYLPQISTRST